MKKALILTALILCGCSKPEHGANLFISEPNLECRDSYRVMWNGQHYKIQRKAIDWERRAYRNGSVWGRSLYDGAWTDEYAMRKPTFDTMAEASAEIDWLIWKRLTDMAAEGSKKPESWVDVTPLLERPSIRGIQVSSTNTFNIFAK